MADHEKLVHRVAEVLHFAGCTTPNCDLQVDRWAESYRMTAGKVVDALGLREAIMWTDDGNWAVQERLDELSYYSDGIYIGSSARLATDDELRAFGLVKKRRWVTGWEVVE